MQDDLFGREPQRYPPPIGYTPPAQFQFNAAADWQRIVAKGLKFEPYCGETTVCPTRGDCLDPLIVEGQHALLVRPFADGEALVDGDLYVVDWADREDPSAKKYARSDGRIILAKFLRYFHALGWCVQWNECISPLNGEVIAKVVGVVPAIGATAHALKLADNAVTEIATNVSAAAVSFTGPSGTLVEHDVISLTVTTSGFGQVEIDVGCMFSFAAATGGTASVANLQIYRDGSPVANAMSYDPTFSGTVTLGQPPIATFVSLVGLDSPPAGSHTYSLHGQFERSSSNGASMSCSNNFIKVLEFKK